MTNGSLIQLVAKGKQNAILNSTPHSNLFKKMFSGHRPFAIETYTLPIDLRFDNHYNVSVPYIGDLLNKCFVHIKLPILSGSIPSGSTYLGWCNSIGHAIIEYISVKIGHQEYDRITGDELEVYTEKEMTEEKKTGYNEMIHKFSDVTELETNAEQEIDLYIPLPFWFCKYPGLSIPLVSLWSHKVEFEFKIRPFNQLVVYDGDTDPEDLLFSITSSSLLMDYIYLDNEERNRWKASAHSYLFEQHQRVSSRVLEGESSKIISVDTYHSTKQLSFVFVEQDSKDNNDHFNYARRADGLSSITNVDIQARGNSLFKTKLSESYLRLIEPFKRSTGITNKYIYQYSFGLKPEEYNPSGFLNFSSLDSNGVFLILDMRSGTKTSFIHVFVTNYNFYTVNSGIAKLKFI